MIRASSLVGLLTLVLSLGAPAPALSQERIRVAASECPPFVIVEDGEVSGLLLFLWDRIALELGTGYDVSEVPLAVMLEALQEQREARRADVGISCLTITAEREQYVDFSHAFFDTYMGIAVRQGGTWETVVGTLSSPAVLKGVGLVAGVAALIGGFFFLLEGKTNEKLYSAGSRLGRWTEALLVGLLFATRGPIRFTEFSTLTARVTAAMLAVGSTVLIAGITAVLASAFTMEGLRSQVSGIDDLRKMRVGTIAASTSAGFLDRNGVAYRSLDDVARLMDDLDRGTLDAVAFDAAFLKYAIKQGRTEGRYESLAVLPYEFEPQSYGFAFLEGSDLEERVNRVLLDILRRPEWRAEVQRYFGE